MANELPAKERRGRTAVPGFDDFAVSVVPAGGAATVTVVGDLDTHTTPRLDDALGALAAGGVRHVTVDLGDSSFMDSTALSVLVDGLLRLRASGGDLVVRSPAPGARRLFAITGMDSVLTVV